MFVLSQMHLLCVCDFYMISVWHLSCCVTQEVEQLRQEKSHIDAELKILSGSQAPYYPSGPRERRFVPWRVGEQMYWEVVYAGFTLLCTTRPKYLWSRAVWVLALSQVRSVYVNVGTAYFVFPAWSFLCIAWVEWLYLFLGLLLGMDH